MLRRALPVALATACITAAAIAGGGILRGPRIVRGPMVQLVEGNELSITWDTSRPMDLEVRLLSGDGSTIVATQSIPATKERTVVRFGDLTVGTKYRYQLWHDGDLLADHPVSTAPPRGASFRVLAFGDSGTGGREQYQLASRMDDFDPDVIVHTGDLVYFFGERKHYPRRFYAPYGELVARVPFYPCLGNHDTYKDNGGPLLAEFVLPPNGPSGLTPERHYWFDFGDVRFVAIDTNVEEKELRERVAPWLDSVLAAAGDRWKVVFFHHTVYSNGRHGDTLRVQLALVPVMESRGVQLVLNGHDHMYERTGPMRGGKTARPGEGVVYVTTGGGGADLYERRSKVKPEVAVIHEHTHSFTILDVSPSAIRLQQIDIDGKQVDEYVIPKSPAANGGN